MNTEFFLTHGWKIVDTMHTAEREAVREGIEDLPLTELAVRFLRQAYGEGIYRHQKIALRAALSGEPVCLATGTASGKSLVFQAAALDVLARHPDARVMALYPMKALGNEQRERWERALQIAGLDATVGRIDGNVPPAMRLGILERSPVVVFTPDIIHAWMFSNLNQKAVLNYLSKVELIVIDEVHAYTGVFGTNSAYLFRRLRHLLSMMGARPRFICASATMAYPEQHLENLIGLSFQLVGSDVDTSPRYPLEVMLVEPPDQTRVLDGVVQFLDYLANEKEARFIAFVDSRKQVELISSILARVQRDAATGKGELESESEILPEERLGIRLAQLNVLPYRAGYEEHDRNLIQSKLTEGSLRGVVSTSALELGMDIPDLDTCVLIGVPTSATSLQQRIGRIGRSGPGTVIVINGGDVYDRAVFANPPSLFERPLAESALYLQNRPIQYIHVLCLARPGGEHSMVLQARNLPESQFGSLVRWPEHFLELCRAERAGETPRDLQGMKNEARDRPNYVFPLREVESQFKVERAQGPSSTSLGTLSFGQLMREAYPGAIYYYAAQPYRVIRVNLKTRQVQVRREKRYTTRPSRLPERIFPRVNTAGIFKAVQQDALVSMECQILVRETINGVIEQRGGKESIYPYPLPRELGFYQDQPFFNRNFFTTGVLISHPVLEAPGVYPPALAELVYEAFLLLIPFDRQDLGWATDSFQQDRPPAIEYGQPFLVIYDQTYGSLRLSARLMETGLLGRVMFTASLLAAGHTGGTINPEGREALARMTLEALERPAYSLRFINAEVETPVGKERVILPGSKGLLMRTSEEFRILRVISMPKGLSYEGVPATMEGSSAATMPLLTDVAEIPGESEVGLYDLETGEITPLLDGALRLEPEAGGVRVEVDRVFLATALGTHLQESTLTRLAEMLGLGRVEGSRAEMAQGIIDACSGPDQLSVLIRALAQL